MLHSLNSSSSHDQEEEEESDHPHQIHQEIPLNLHFLPYHHHHQKIVPLLPPPLPPQAGLFPLIRGSSSSSFISSSAAASSSSLTSSIHLRQLLIRCAELLSQSNFSTAHQILSFLSCNSSPHGDSSERLTHYFTRALSLHLNPDHHPQDDQERGENTNESLQSCYLSLNQVTPFIRFSHLTANQAILEAIEQGQTPGQGQGEGRGEGQPLPIHIIDFNIMHGVQWPPFMQALADRYGSSSPLLRITATGNDLTTLHRTGDRLSKFAQSLGLRFQFNPLLLLDDDPTSLALFLPSAIRVFPDEALAVNCVLYLHRLIKDDEEDEDGGGGGDDMKLFLQRIKSLSPKVVTIAEREANHNHPVFMQRFMEALDHFSAIFDSLEATLPGNSRERLEVERVWLGKEIMDILGISSCKSSSSSSIGSGGMISFLRRSKENIINRRRRERHQRYESWEGLMRSAGFSNVALSSFALSQAKLLLRLHYPSEGYHLQVLNDSFFLGWHNRALFSVSSWR